ncbi:cyclic GMP-AMP synthase-like [Clytia hemisphaerica]|uniref:Mab-21-like HhH/H2TH-like domain-containing protein n=1 Tax=Clytia hemisphaerica TaxID=252671 RepID=A0A7M5XBA2_9CNID
MAKSSKVLLSYYQKEVLPSTEDRKRSKSLARDHILRELLENISDPVDKNLYKGSLEKAGSTSTNTKINLADEFDFDLHLNIRSFSLDRKCLRYKFTADDDTTSLNVQKSVVMLNANAKEPLPSGFIQIKSDQAPGKLRVGEHLAPRRIHEDLYRKLSNLKKDVPQIKDVSIQKKPHGPAITLTYHKPGEHHIDIDLSPSLFTNDIKVPVKVWKREFFKTNPKVTDMLKDVPILLVPKKENCWLISYEKIMKELFNRIDGEGTCRKICHMILKYDILKWKSQDKEGFEGMSTNPIKHHLLWFNDQHPDNEYWSTGNLARCFKAMLEDLESRIRERKIPNYFDDKTNLLAGKDSAMLKRFADRLHDRRAEVERLENS